jgi:hypothetical protein
MLGPIVPSPASVVHLYCNGSAEVKEYHVLAAFWSEGHRSDDQSVPYACLGPCAMPFRAVQASLPVIEDPPQAKIHDLINHDLESGSLAGI